MKSARREPRARWGLLLALVVQGCAPALPSFAGSRTTPDGRVDVALGMAARIPTGDLARDDGLMALAGPGGIAPAGAVRVGLSRELDLGIVVSGAAGRAELRYGGRFGQLRAHLGVAGFGGYATTRVDVMGAQGAGWRAGAFVPLTLAFDVAGILEAWLGARFALERVEGALGPSDSHADTRAWGIRAGGVVGLALGFRRVHLLAELAVDGEWWSGRTADVALERAGVALTPAFAVRARF
ncbi:MAG: hypothetical protein OHK0013_36720 [Sandaracinaceae bacterium]